MQCAGEGATHPHPGSGSQAKAAVGGRPLSRLTFRPSSPGRDLRAPGSSDVSAVRVSRKVREKVQWALVSMLDPRILVGQGSQNQRCLLLRRGHSLPCPPLPLHSHCPVSPALRPCCTLRGGSAPSISRRSGGQLSETIRHEGSTGREDGGNEVEKKPKTAWERGRKEGESGQGRRNNEGLGCRRRTVPAARPSRPPRPAAARGAACGR